LLDGGDGLTVEALANLGVAAGVAEVIMRHVRGLSPLAVKLLTAAAAIGHDFALGIVARLVDDASTDDIIAALDEAIDAGLIVESPAAPDSFAFAHAVVRESLYRQLAHLRRARMHERVAHALEAAYGEAERNPVELAYHYDQARSLAGSEPARRYAMLAGPRAAALFSY